MEKKSRIIIIGLFVLQLATMLLSWLFTALMPTSHFHSLFDSEGIRWLYGQLPHLLQSPLLPLLVLWWVAVNAFLSSRKEPRSYDIWGDVILPIIVLIIFLYPYPALRNATGALFPSSWSRGVLYIAAIAIFIYSLLRGLFRGCWQEHRQMFKAFTKGSRQLVILLFVIMQLSVLIAMIRYSLSGI